MTLLDGASHSQLGHFQQLQPVFLGQVNQSQKNHDRQHLGKLTDELTFALARKTLDQFNRQQPYIAFHCSNGLWKECRRDERTISSVLRRIELQRHQRRILSRGDVHPRMRKALMVFLYDFDIDGASGNPMPTVIGRPDDVGSVVQGLPGQVNIGGHIGRSHKVEIDDTVAGDMFGHGPGSRCIHYSLHGCCC
ncbi:hypothetical protein D3C75_634910 [compost metagenome]